MKPESQQNANPIAKMQTQKPQPVAEASFVILAAMNPAPTPAAHLPAPLPSPAALLHRTQAALELLRDVVQESSAEYWYERGKAASVSEKWDDAYYSLVYAIKLDPTFEKKALPVLLFKSGGFIDKVNQLPDETPNRHHECVAMLEKGIICCDIVIRMKPDYSDAFRLRGDTKSKLGKFNEALDDYNHAISLAPLSFHAFYGRAKVKDLMGDRVGSMADVGTAEAIKSARIREAMSSKKQV